MLLVQGEYNSKQYLFHSNHRDIYFLILLLCIPVLTIILFPLSNIFIPIHEMRFLKVKFDFYFIFKLLGIISAIIAFRYIFNKHCFHVLQQRVVQVILSLPQADLQAGVTPPPQKETKEEAAYVR